VNAIRPFLPADWPATWTLIEPVVRAGDTYRLPRNMTEPAAHVCTCGYIVGEASRGRGVASAMVEHSEREAIGRDYRALQFNMVVSTNDAAVRLWLRHGFEIVGTLPGAFRHPTRGYVDAFVMYKKLER
jgi:GNAT superfamily N-acetyltransferase